MTRVLIIKPSSLGDIIHGLQAVTCLKAAHPAWHVTWVVREIFAPLVEAAECVDETIIFQRKQGLVGILGAMRNLRQRHFDLVLDLQGLLRSGLMTWSANAPRKIGRHNAREGSSLFYTETTTPITSGNRKHALDELLQFAHILGTHSEILPPIRFRTETNIPELVAFGSDSPPIILFPESRRREKMWPYFAELTELLLASHPSLTIIWAGSDPSAFAPTPPQPDRFLNLCGKLPLEQLPALLSHASLVIANDSGPMHLAAAMAKPTLAIFGPTDPSLYGPYPPERPSNHVLIASEGILSNLSAREVMMTLTSLLPAPQS
jgi:heptosyltransferase-1